MDRRIGRLVLIGAWVLALGVIAGAAGSQDVAAPPRPPAPVAPDTPPPVFIGPPAHAPTLVSPPTSPGADASDDDADDTAEAPPPRPKPVVPEGPPPPARAPSAVLRVLDKITAETMAFEAPIGRRVRFKTLVFEVKACEIRDTTVPKPQPSAYLIVTSQAAGAGSILSSRQLFRGWMFADAPGVHAITHPVYDAWLVSCNAAAPLT